MLSLDEKLRHAAFATCASAFGRGQLMLWSPMVQCQKIAVVHCGLRSHFFEREIESPCTMPQLVCVGQLVQHKAQIRVEDLRQLRDKGVICDVVLVRRRLDATTNCSSALPDLHHR